MSGAFEALADDDLSPEHNDRLVKHAASMRDWGAGQALLIGSDDVGHVMAATVVIERPTEYLGLIIEADHEGRMQFIFAAMPKDAE